MEQETNGRTICFLNAGASSERCQINIYTGVRDEIPEISGNCPAVEYQEQR